MKVRSRLRVTRVIGGGGTHVGVAIADNACGALLCDRTAKRRGNNEDGLAFHSFHWCVGRTVGSQSPRSRLAEVAKIDATKPLVGDFVLAS
jgi:hypothetical protein